MTGQRHYTNSLIPIQLTALTKRKNTVMLFRLVLVLGSSELVAYSSTEAKRISCDQQAVFGAA